VSNSLYITSLEPQSGKTVAALAFMEHLSGRVERLSLFRPVVSDNVGSDNLTRLMMDLYSLRFSPDEMYGVIFADAHELLAAGKYDELYGRILERYKSLESRSDFVLCVGTDYSGVSMALEFDFNVGVARNLGVSMIPIVNGQGKDLDMIVNAVRALSESMEAGKCDIAAVLVNRIEQNKQDELRASLKKRFPDTPPVYVLPENPLLERPTVREISTALEAKQINGNDDLLDGEVANVKVGAMELPNFLDHLEDGSLVITPGDRSDIIIGTLAAYRSTSYPRVAGLVLTGNLSPAPQVRRLMEGLLTSPVPVLTTGMDTFTAATCISKVRPSFTAQNKRRSRLFWVLSNPAWT